MMPALLFHKHHFLCLYEGASLQSVQVHTGSKAGSIECYGVRAGILLAAHQYRYPLTLKLPR